MKIIPALVVSSALVFVAGEARATSGVANQGVVTVGDFNGDSIGDLIIVTPSGSYEYDGKLGGGFSSSWQRTGTPYSLGHVTYAVGDYNGDGYSDVIMTNASGSTLWTGSYIGLIQAVWSRSDLTLGNVEYTVGDFNSDSCFDLLITTATGTYEYMGANDPPYGFLGYQCYYQGLPFVPNQWVRTDLTLSTARFSVIPPFQGAPSRPFFNIDPYDLLITTDSGTYHYGGMWTGYGGGFYPNEQEWTSGAYQRSEYPEFFFFYWPDITGPQKLGPGAFFAISEATGFTDADVWIGGGYPYYDNEGTQPFPFGPPTATGDFNGDGNSDFIADSRADYAAEYLACTSYGDYCQNTGFEQPYAFGQATTLTVSDFNGDGISDVIATGTTGSTEWLGTARGNFTSTCGSSYCWNRTDLTSAVTKYF